jgi:hypothetical protein
MADEKFFPHPLDEDTYGSKDPPRVVIRQEGDSFQVLFLEERLAFQVKYETVSSICDCFDPKISQLWFDPGRKLAEEVP